MPKITSEKITTRFGTRYGKRNKLKFAQAEMSHRSTHQCPYCKYDGVKRAAAGIWQCKKCNSTFTARAYSPQITKLKREDDKQQQQYLPIEESKQTEEEDDEPGVKAPDMMPEEKQAAKEAQYHQPDLEDLEASEDEDSEEKSEAFEDADDSSEDDSEGFGEDADAEKSEDAEASESEEKQKEETQ